MVEAAGIEPASESSSTTASTCVVYLLSLAPRPPGRQGVRHASPIRNSPAGPQAEAHALACYSRRPGQTPQAGSGGTGHPLVRQPLRTSYRSQLRFFPTGLTRRMGPRHAALASPPPSNPGRPHRRNHHRTAPPGSVLTNQNIANLRPHVKLSASLKPRCHPKGWRGFVFFRALRPFAPSCYVFRNHSTVQRSPSSGSTFGSQPRSFRARLMSGWRTFGSSAIGGSNTSRLLLSVI